MSTVQPLCPSCALPLVLTHQGGFDTWVCPSSDGLAATLSEGYERFQEDELDQVWSRARMGAPSARRCPVCEQAMVVVDVAFDGDEVPEGQASDGPDQGAVEIDVCRSCQMLWFDTSEDALLPGDLPDAEPSADELARIAEIRQEFGQAIVEAHEDRVEDQLTERAARFLGRHPGFVRFLGQKPAPQS